MKRRTMLGAIATGTTSACSGLRPRFEHRSTIILVHGAWHGAWCWERVTPLLRSDGWNVMALTLPGLAQRRAELSPAIDLESHIAEVVNAAADVPGRIALVGHSYGGFVVTGAADRLAASERLSSITYLDAFVPSDGEKVSDYMAPEAREALQAAFARGDAAYPPPPVRFFGVVDPADAAWAQSCVSPQPAGTYLQPLRLRGSLPERVQRSYIACQNPRLPVFDKTKARIRSDPAWRYRELQAAHDAMITAPRELAALLGALAAAD